MRLAAALAALLLLPACGELVEPVPFTVLIDNPGATARYLEGVNPQVDLRVRRDGEWLEVHESQERLCRPQCGVPGRYDCLSSPAVYEPRAFALLPGEALTVELDGDGWIIDPDGGCIRPVSHGGELRIEVCHAGELQEPGGAVIDEPTVGGPFEGDAELVDPDCDRQTVVILQDDEIVFDVSEQ